MAFKGRDLVGCKIVINNKIIDKIISFNYVRSLISFEKEVNIDNKLSNYLKMAGAINNMFRLQKRLLKTRINYALHQPFELCCMVVKTGP